VSALLTFAAAVLFLLAALGFFAWLVHITIATALGLLALGLLCKVLAGFAPNWTVTRRAP
jgi:hypothetical protein